MKCLLMLSGALFFNASCFAHEEAPTRPQNSTIPLNVSHPLGALARASDDEQKWIALLRRNPTLNWSNEQAKAAFTHWVGLANQAIGALSQPASQENVAFASLYLRLAFWVKSLPPSEFEVLRQFATTQTFSDPAGAFIARSLSTVLAVFQKEPIAESDLVAHARLALMQVGRFERSLDVGLRSLVQKRPDGTYELIEHAQAEWFENNGSGIRVLSSREWVSRLIRDYGVDYLDRWASALDAERKGRVLFLIAQSRGAVPVAKGDAHHSNADALAAEHAAHYLEHIGKTPREREAAWDMRPENKPLYDNKSSNRVSRQQALSDPFVQSVLDKCISCHVMYSDPSMTGAFVKLEKQSDGTSQPIIRDPSAIKYVTRAALSNALLIDPGPGLQGFQRKINDMLGKNANVRHVHFTQFERDALERIINFTVDDPKAVPLNEAEELADRRRPARSMTPVEASLYDDPALLAAQFRCVECHRDPALNVPGVNTFTGLRAAMLDPSFTQETLTRMINYGYNNERPIHIRNLNEEPLIALSADFTILNHQGGVRKSPPLMMKTKLEEFIRQRDRGSARSGLVGARSQ